MIAVPEDRFSERPESQYAQGASALHEGSDRRSLAFAPHLRAHVLCDEEVVLLSERERFALNGRVYVALAPLLDGSHSAEELVATLCEHSPAVIHLALMRLQEPGYVVEVGAVGARPPRAKNPPPLPESAGPPITVPVSSLRDVVALGLPGSWARRLARTAPRAAAHARPRSGLTVCLVDDYLRPELAVTAAACLKQGENLLVVRPVGRWLWFGPLLHGPASEALWQLFCERVRMNRSADVTALERGASFPLFPDDRSPATVQLAISIAGGLVSRVVEGRPPFALTNGILTYDTLEGTFAHHPVERIPPPRRDEPPGVGDTTAPIQRHGPSAGFSHYGDRTCSSLETLARMERFVSPITGIVSAPQPVASVGGMHVFAAVHPQAPAAMRHMGRALGRKGGAWGKGPSEEQARASCIGEAIERYSGGFFGDERRRRARLAEIAEIALHPEELLLFSDAQYAARHATREGRGAAERVPARFDSSQAIEWVPVSSLMTGEARWVPAPYCYYGHRPSSAEGYRGEPFCFADSNGCASGNTLEEAILHGLLELLERDACALAWYNRIRRPEIDLDSFEDEPFRRVGESYSRRGRELHVLDVRTDTAVAAVLAVAWNRADGLSTRFGLGCHLNPRIAVSRSLSELAQIEAEASIAGAGPRFEPFASSSIHGQPHLIPSSQPPVSAGDLPDFTRSDLAEELHWCCSMLAGLGHEVLILDQTRPEVGFPTVRVIVPGLRHFWRRLAPGRLYDVPVALGWIEAPLREDELNPLSVTI